MTLHPQYIIDLRGKRKGVLLPLDEYEELLEMAQDVIDAALIEETKEQPRSPWRTVKARAQQTRR